ncbi:MAG: protein-glutamine glutaminase family protein [Halobacteriovoraceae bacterium]|nr:protein-glutamine glutaminase family protein [Halobacteriovoraceae bacterium]
MRVSLFLLTICFYCNIVVADPTVEDAILGFNQVASTSTLPVDNCEKRSPPEVIFEEGLDANKLHEQVALSLKGPFETAEYEGDQITVLSKEQADQLFKDFSEVGYMKFDYLHAGCETRAHEFAMIAKVNGIEMGKGMTVYGNGDRSKSGLFPQEWKDKMANDEAIPVPEGFVGWYHHVAPYLLVKEGEEIKPYVFDIGVAEKPKTLDQWKASLINSTQKETSTYVRERAVIHPDMGPREVEESYISSEINKQKLIREMGIWEFEYWNEKGLLNY